MAQHPPKIIDKIRQRIEENKPFFSFEFFPPKTEEGAVNLYLRFDRMATMAPLFIDVTWSAGGSELDPNDKLKTLEICANAQQYCCLLANMHLTSNVMTRQEILDILKKTKEKGIRNILALRGDPPQNVKNWSSEGKDFKHAVDLVRLIRAEYGDYFCISVAGYPYGHPDCPSYEEDIQHLKEKVDAGADFVISQLFFRAEDFLKWVRDCRKVGITCPILPGILPIQGYHSLRNISKMCSVPLPDTLTKAIEPIKDDDAAIKELGIKLAVEMCRELLNAGVYGLHFYTLNREVATAQIVKELGLVKDNEIYRELPWKKPVSEKRLKEDVRPIFWANRTKSYLSRTANWDEFPNGRWGDSRSPAFGELTDYHIFLHYIQPKPEELRKIWGANPQTPEDVGQVFVNYIEGKISQLPWIDGPLSLESNLIKDSLIRINSHGFWTINSQPRVNGAPSTDKAVGWGGPNGVVYQKAYIEFFCSPTLLTRLLNALKDYKMMTYQAVNRRGQSIANTNSVCAVTWGVFPGKEIIQPTVVDPVSFMVWKEEAFQLWLSKWARIYDEGSPSRKLIEWIHDTYWLVNIVDNDFINGNIFEVFDRVIAETQLAIERGDTRPLSPTQELSFASPPLSPLPRSHYSSWPAAASLNGVRSLSPPLPSANANGNCIVNSVSQCPTLASQETKVSTPRTPL
jgi:methylenetetrahydrofolate reductase (NADPH)